MIKMKNKYIIMNIEDNCATSLDKIPQDEELEINNSLIKIKQEIPFGHKFALKNINKGNHVIKYSEIIGIAIKDIKAGDWVHIHNIQSHYLEETK